MKFYRLILKIWATLAVVLITTPLASGTSQILGVYGQWRVELVHHDIFSCWAQTNNGAGETLAIGMEPGEARHLGILYSVTELPDTTLVFMKADNGELLAFSRPELVDNFMLIRLDSQPRVQNFNQFIRDLSSSSKLTASYLGDNPRLSEWSLWGASEAIAALLECHRLIQPFGSS